MKTYKISDSGLDLLKRKSIIRSLPFFLIAIGVSILLTQYGPNADNQSTEGNEFIYPIMTLLLGAAIVMAYRRNGKLLESFEIAIDDEGIKRTQDKTPEIYLSKEDIQAAYALKEGGIKLQGKSKTSFILIPPLMEEKEELSQKIQAWMELEPLPESSLRQKLSRLLAIPFIGSMLLVFLADNKMLVGIAGAFFVGFAIWSMLEIRRSQHLDKRVKKAAWWMLLLIFSVLFVVISKISA